MSCALRAASPGMRLSAPPPQCRTSHPSVTLPQLSMSPLNFPSAQVISGISTGGSMSAQVVNGVARSASVISGGGSMRGNSMQLGGVTVNVSESPAEQHQLVRQTSCPDRPQTPDIVRTLSVPSIPRFISSCIQPPADAKTVAGEPSTLSIAGPLGIPASIAGLPQPYESAPMMTRNRSCPDFSPRTLHGRIQIPLNDLPLKERLQLHLKDIQGCAPIVQGGSGSALLPTGSLLIQSGNASPQMGGGYPRAMSASALHSQPRALSASRSPLMQSRTIEPRVALSQHSSFSPMAQRRDLTPTPVKTYGYGVQRLASHSCPAPQCSPRASSPWIGLKPPRAPAGSVDPRCVSPMVRTRRSTDEVSVVADEQQPVYTIACSPVLQSRDVKGVQLTAKFDGCELTPQQLSYVVKGEAAWEAIGKRRLTDDYNVVPACSPGLHNTREPRCYTPGRAPTMNRPASACSPVLKSRDMTPHTPQGCKVRAASPLSCGPMQHIEMTPQTMRAVSTKMQSRVTVGSSPHPAQCNQRQAQGRTLEFDTLDLEYTFFNPTQQPMKSQLLEKLGLRPNAKVDPIRGLVGACNAGMWTVSDGNQNLMLKLVRNLPAFMGPQKEPESEKFSRLHRENPEMVSDPALSFPFKIYKCQGKGGSQANDLIVMRKVGGVRASEYIMQKLHGGQIHDLMKVLEQFGNFLASFHNRYNGLQHGDLTPANFFIEQHRGGCKFTLVDVADIAPRNPVIDSDVNRFISGLKLLSNFYGPDLWSQGKMRFEAGYNARITTSARDASTRRGR